MAVSGGQLTRIGASLFGVGKKLSITAKEPTTIIVSAGVGYNAIMNNNGIGILGVIYFGSGSATTMNNNGIGNDGAISNDGIGESTIL